MQTRKPPARGPPKPPGPSRKAERERRPRAPRVLLYARSTRGDRCSTAVQFAVMRYRAKLAGWQVVHEMAHTGGTRKASDALVAFARQRLLDKIAVWSVDRIAGTIEEAVSLEATLRRRGVSVVSCWDDLDTATPQGRRDFWIQAGLAEMMREESS